MRAGRCQFDDGHYLAQFDGVLHVVGPKRVRALQRYVQQGIHPGAFLRAILENDLREAVASAGEHRLRNIPAFVAYCHNEIPHACWGSRAKVAAWLELEGLEGLEGSLPRRKAKSS